MTQSRRDRLCVGWREFERRLWIRSWRYALPCGSEAARRDISRAFLQVETGNAAAIGLYQRCGFRHSHRYHYRVAPPQG